MKTLFSIIIFLFFGNCFSQNNVVIIERNYMDKSCSKKQKLQYTYDQNGNILEYIIFGEHHNPDTTHIGNISKYEYKESKLFRRTDYVGTYLTNDTHYFYKNGLFDSIKFNDGKTLKYIYYNRGNVKSNIMKVGSDTLRIITYSYVGNKLSEVFRFDNRIENEKTKYSKSYDTIIETTSRYDSIHVDKPLIFVTKKKYVRNNLIFSSSFYNENKSSTENSIVYDSYGNFKSMDVIYIEKGSVRKEKFNFIYKDELISKIEEFELVNNIWQFKHLIVYEKEKPKMELSKKIKKKINQYFLEKYKSTL